MQHKVSYHLKKILWLFNTNMHILSLTYVEQTIRALIFFPQTGPKDNTVSEFWCMVWQEDIDQIIMLTNLREGRKVKKKF